MARVHRWQHRARYPREVPFRHRQPGRKVARIGILSFAGTARELVGPDPARPSAKALLVGLHKLGDVYGRDFVTDDRRAAAAIRLTIPPSVLARADEVID